MAVGNHTMPSEILSTCTDGLFWCTANWAYTVTSGIWWTALLIGFVFSLYMATIFKFGNTRAFGFASMVGLIGAVWFAIARLMPWWIATIFILTGVIGIASMVMKER